MSISIPLKTYLDQHHIKYDLVNHRHTETSVLSAVSAHVPVESMVKGVLLEDEQGYMMAAVPASRQVSMNSIRKHTGRNLRLAGESELSAVIAGCEYGAVPAIGEAFGLQTIWDEHLAAEHDLYIEAGDHQELVHMKQSDFVGLMNKSNRAVITH